MIEGRRVLAVVPARAGSKGAVGKNMRPLLGLSLIGWAARTLRHLEYLDARIISTDSPEYAAEGARYGLEAPFLRPAELSGDRATAVDTMAHSLAEMESRVGNAFDVILVIEPTSPLRIPDDITRTLMHLIREGRDSAVAVSRLDSKWHPRKAFRIVDRRVALLVEADVAVSARQELDDLYWRNGVCYAVTRECLLKEQLIIGRNCAAEIIEHPVVNIDADWEFDWAEFLLARQGGGVFRAVVA